MARVLTYEQKIGFAHEFREARAGALRDAEAFEEHLFVLERLGSFVCGHNGGLGPYRTELKVVALCSPLAMSISDQHPDLHMSFDTLYEQVREARNDAMHQGAVARLLARHAQELAMIMEDALMADAKVVGDFMVRDPLCALRWQPLGTIRRNMLMNAFSFLPFKDQANNSWRLLADYALAKFLRVDHQERGRRLLMPLEEALGKDGAFRDECKEAKTIAFSAPVAQVMELIDATPCVVLRSDGEMAGLITAFDVL